MSSVILTVGLLLSLPLMGWLAFSILIDGKQRRKQLPLLDSIFLCCFSGLAFYAWLSFVLAELGMFSPWILLASGSIVCAGLGAYLVNSRIGPFVPSPLRPSFDRLLLVLVLLGAALVYMQPAETIFGSSDAGIRLSSAANIARTGGILHVDPLLSNGGPASPLVGELDDGSGVRVRLLGFNIWDESRGVVAPQFASVNETLIAIPFSIFGLSSVAIPPTLAPILGWLQPAGPVPLVLYLIPAVGLLGLVAFYLFVSEVAGRAAGLIAAILLATSIAEIWHARVPMSEILSQLFIFAGLYSLAAGRRVRSRYVCLLGGVSIGLALLVRVDSFLLLAPLALYLLYIWWREPGDRRLIIATAVPVGLLTAHYLLHYGYFSAGYLTTNLLAASRLLGAQFVAMVVSGALLLVGVATLRFSGRWYWPEESFWRPFKWFLAVALGGVTVYGYFVWPFVSSSRVGRDLYLGMPVDWSPAANLVKLGWYLSPLGLALAVLGAVLLLLRPTSPVRALFLGAAVIYTLIFVANSMVSPSHPNWIRRFLPVVVPSAIALEAIALTGIAHLRVRHRAVGLGLSTILLLSLLVLTVGGTWSLLRERNYPGVERAVSAFAGTLPENAVVLMEPGDSAQRLAVPLTYLYERSAFTLYRDPFDRSLKSRQEEVERAVLNLLAAGRDVYYAAFDGITTIEPGKLTFESVGPWVLASREVVELYDGIPAKSGNYSLNLWLYRLRESEPKPFAVGEAGVDVGGPDYGYLVSGFYRPEQTSGSGGGALAVDYRWTEPVARMSIPWPAGTAYLRMTVSGHRPEGAPESNIAVKVNGTRVGSAELPWRREEAEHPEFTEVVIPVSPGLVAAGELALLELEVPGWIAPGDGRQLGVMLDRVDVSQRP